MGRETLIRAIDSVLNQSVNDCDAIVVFDDRYKEYAIPEAEKIKVVLSDNYGHAGILRNDGINLVQSEWTAFLDDDDWLEPSYVQKLRGYAVSHPQIDLFIFTYYDEINGNTVPDKRQTKIEECKVGISFAVKTDFINKHNIRFTPFAIEDFRFLDECVKAGAKYHITHDLQYRVGGRGGWLRKDNE